MHAHPLGQELAVVDTLRTRENLLTAHKEVVRVRVVGVFGVGHGIEGPDGKGEFVKDVEVSVVLFVNELAETTLVRRAEILKVAEVGAVVGFAEHLDALFEAETEDLTVLGELEFADGVLLADGGDFGGIAGLEVLEDEEEHFLDDIEDFVVVRLEGHFEIETGELSHVPVALAVLCAEDGGNLKDLLHVAGNEHLLVELRALGEVGLGLEVCDLKDVGASLGCSTEKLRGMELGKVAGGKELAEELADTRRDAEDGLVGKCPQIDNTVVETGRQRDSSKLNALLSSLGLGLLLISRRIGKGDGELGNSLRDEEELGDVDLQVGNGGGCDWGRGLEDLSVDDDDGLEVDTGSPLGKLLRDGSVGVNGSKSLDRGNLLAEDHEGHLGSLSPGRLDTSSEGNFFSIVGIGQVAELDPGDIDMLCRLNERKRAVVALCGIDIGSFSGSLLLSLLRSAGSGFGSLLGLLRGLLESRLGGSPSSRGQRRVPPIESLEGQGGLLLLGWSGGRLLDGELSSLLGNLVVGHCGDVCGWYR